jgi:hypothetical protein
MCLGLPLTCDFIITTNELVCLGHVESFLFQSDNSGSGGVHGGIGSFSLYLCLVMIPNFGRQRSADSIAELRTVPSTAQWLPR